MGLNTKSVLLGRTKENMSVWSDSNYYKTITSLNHREITIKQKVTPQAKTDLGNFISCHLF